MAPPLLERFVTALLGDDESTPYVIGDLREEHDAWRRRLPGALAALRYLAAGIGVAAGVRRERRRRAREARRRAHTSTAATGDHMRTDLRQAMRFLLRRPASSAAIVLTVSLAVACTTVAFAVVDGVLLEPLPYRSPDRLVAVWEKSAERDRNVVSPANFLGWRDDLRSFDALAALFEGSTTLLGETEPEQIGYVQASAAYFEAVGAEAVVGRLYGESEDVFGGPSVLVLSESFWRRRFAADPDVVGTTVRVGNQGTAYEVLGVLADRYDFDLEWAFAGIGSHDVWLPPGFAPAARQSGGRSLQVVARLAEGASLESARAETAAHAARLAEENPDLDRGWEINVVPLQGDLVQGARSIVLVVFGAVCFVLLIACANVANLLITRGAERRQEMAVRSALGARRGRIVGQLLAESAVLSVTGGIAGLLLARWGVRALVASAPDLPRLESIGMDGSVIAFSLLAMAGTALLFGLAPALPLVRADGVAALRDRGADSGVEARRLRGLLSVLQVSLSMVLLVGAGLLGRSLVNRLDVGIGFDVENLLSAEVQLPAGRYPSPQTRALFFDRLVERARAIPGVEDASAITWLPLAGGGTRTSFWPLDRPAPEVGEEPGADVRWVHRDYLRVTGIPVLAGRSFAASDDADAPLVVLVSETTAERTWPGESALGKRIAMPWNDTLVAEVVGVVGDVRHDGPDSEAYPMLYWEHRQFNAFRQMSLVVRADAGARAGVVAGLRGALAELDPTLPLYNVRPLDELFADAIKRARLATLALGTFSLLALLLAAIGIYGVIAHATQRRAREIGIRMALGAARPSILGMVLRQGMVHVAIAIPVGIGAALALSRVLGSLVFDVSATDPATFAAMAAVLAATALVACWLPARRASGIDPAETIRRE